MITPEERAKIKSDILIEIPFTDEELTDPIFDRAVETSFDLLNKYHPKVVKSGESIEIPGYTLLTAYTSEFDKTSNIPFIDEYQLNLGGLYIYSTDWNLGNIKSAPKHIQIYYNTLITSHCAMYMANKRRMATMMDLPVDLRGEEFYSEYSDKINVLVEEMTNTMTNTH